MHAVNLYVMHKRHDVSLNFPHVIFDGKYLLIPITDDLMKIAGVDYDEDMEDSYRKGLETYLLNLTFDGSMAWVETEYFGGAGDQSADVWINRQKFPLSTNINDALERIRIPRTADADQFDLVGLGNYRTNEDVITEWNERNGVTTEIMCRRALLKSMPDIFNAKFRRETRVYINNDHYYMQSGNKFYSVRTNTDVMYTENCPPVLKMTVNKKRCTKEEFDAFYGELDSPNSYSRVFVDFPHTEDDNNFYRIIGNDTTINIVDLPSDNEGNITVHPLLNPYILLWHEVLYIVRPAVFGLTGLPAVKSIEEPNIPVLTAKPPVKSTMDVYECTACEDGIMLPFKRNAYRCQGCGNEYTVT